MKQRIPDKPSEPTRPAGEQTAAAALLAKLRRGGDVRSRKTRRLRGAVRANRYENDLKLAIAMENMLRDL